MAASTPQPDSARGFDPRQPFPEDPDVKRARVLAQLDLERRERPERFRLRMPLSDPLGEYERRCEALEAEVVALWRALDELRATGERAA